MGAQEQDPGCDDDGTCVPCIICCFVSVVLLAPIINLIVLSCMSTATVYSVTITGVACLDPTANPASSLSPVFNLTVRIDNAGNRMDQPCIGRLSTTSVSYQDALLARGSVPEFCAKEREVQERGARAWGQGVVLPQFLRDQLAGELAAREAAVDVKVTTPAEDSGFGDKVYVCSQVKIGGGPATCRKTTVYNQQQANPGSTYVI